jgi:rubrerythrin
MATKKELLSMLHEAIGLEDHVVLIELENFAERVEDGKLKQVLKELIKDTSHHVLDLAELIEKVEKSEKDDF